MKRNKKMIIAFITPALVTFLVMFVYPVIRTVIMSFFKVESLTASTSEWQFAGLDNYIGIWKTPIFRTSMINMGVIWLVGGVIVLSVSLLLAVILTSGVRFKSFFRAAIYLPNVISAVALAIMWIQYVFSKKYGMLTSFFRALGLDNLAKISWLDSDMKFWAMLIAFCFGAVGYYMLIFLSGIEQIPQDLFEAATIDGANKMGQFAHITLPLLKGVFKTNLTFWSINTMMFFVWSKMFSPVETEASTISPVVYMYNIVFGTKGVTQRDAGRGAAIGVTMALFVLIIFFIFNRVLKDDDLEY
ncbi:MAG: sugar ABC transporter permease [Lachnospiraceae bacterium]|nr:sugar ABC transporter permease [Lachnospiraceae bacterium]